MSQKPIYRLTGIVWKRNTSRGEEKSRFVLRADDNGGPYHVICAGDKCYQLKKEGCNA